MRSGQGNSENRLCRPENKNLPEKLDDPVRARFSVNRDHSSSSRGLRSKPSAMSAFSAVQVQVVAARAPAKVSAALICPHTHRTVAPIDGITRKQTLDRFFRNPFFALR